MMKTTKKSVTIKIVITLFVLVTFGSLFAFKYYYSDDTNTGISSEKALIINELKLSKKSLDSAIAENTVLKDALMLEREKVNDLLEAIKNPEITGNMILNFRKETTRLKALVEKLKREKQQLLLSNKEYKNERDSTIAVLSSSKRQNDTLLAINDKLRKVVYYKPVLSIIKFETKTLKKSKSSELIPTDKAKKVNLATISFIIIGNRNGRPIDKKYFVQVIDSKNNVKGENATITFGESILNYSYAVEINFNTESQEIINDLELKALEKGIYTVNIFDNNKLIGTTSFELK